jgi:hypothetical protein
VYDVGQSRSNVDQYLGIGFAFEYGYKLFGIASLGDLITILGCTAISNQSTVPLIQVGHSAIQSVSGLSDGTYHNRKQGCQWHMLLVGAQPQVFGR